MDTMFDHQQEDGAARARLLSGLNPAQAEAVVTDADVVRILAGAGSGKTRVLTRRIARRVIDGDIDPRRVLAVTFTRKAASELRQRIGQLGLRGGVNAGTFHAVAYTQLRQRWAERGVDPPELLDRKVGFVSRLMRAKSSTLPLDVVGEIEWAKARMISAADYPAMARLHDRRTALDAGVVAEIYAKYEQEKLRALKVDFDDLLRLATRDIEINPEFAAARQWRFRHLFVDEFQDVNPLQFRLLRAWVGPQPDLCVVGDPNQAIYAWNGADSRYLVDFDEQFPGAATIELTENYRSSPQILGVANTVLSTTAARQFRLLPNRPDGPLPVVRSFADEVAEARGIARLARDAHGPGASWSEQAVLVRTNAQLAPFEEAFAQAGIPVRSRGGTRFLDQPEIRDLVRGFGRRAEPLSTRLADLDLALRAAQASPREPSSLDGLNEERLANVAELVRLGREFLDLEPDGSSATFATWLDSALRNEGGTTGGDAVDLATFHAAKGLEWPTVYLAGLEEGLVPIHFAATAEAAAEEVRLLYVAITRAERNLVMSRAERRTFGSRTLQRSPSPFLDTVELALELLRNSTSAGDLDAEVAALMAERARLRSTSAKSAGSGRGGRSTRRSEVSDLNDDDSALLDRLKRWRVEQSRAADVPAFVIFNDETLTEVARRRPASHQELLGVKGIGTVKAQRFGPELLRLVAQHVEATSDDA